MAQRAKKRQARDWYERAVVENVRRYGWHCTSVDRISDDGERKAEGKGKGENEGDHSFSYTVGLFETWKQPELLVFNLPPEVAHGVFSLVAGFAAKGRPLDLDKPSDELLENYPCVFVRVPPSAYRDYVFSASWFYGRSGFPVCQLVWPSEEGYFPWHPAAPEAYLRSQPVLGQYPRGA